MKAAYCLHNIRRSYLRFGLMLMIAMHLLSCSSNKKNKNITVFSAASLTEVMTALVDSFEHESKVKVTLNFASSGTLARQIEMGAGADVFLSANKQWVDYLCEEEVAQENFIEVVAGNSLVMISNEEKKMSLSEAVNARFVMGDPQMVPVGSYTKKALENQGLWKDDHAFLYGRDVKHVLKLVEMGEAEVGIVYKTDVSQRNKVHVIQTLPEAIYPPVKYYICDLRANTSSTSKEFIKYLKSQKGQLIWKKFGFNHDLNNNI